MKTEFETATTDLARRVPPHSVEAERAVLAGLILRPSAMGQIAPMLHPEDFYLPAHQTLYAAALGLHTDNRPVDLVTLAEHLRDQGSLEQAGGAAYIADLAQSHVSAANAEYYAKLVRDKSIQRGLIEAGAKIVSTGFDTSKDLAGLIDEAEQSVMAVSSRTSSGGFRPVQALVGDVVDAVLKPAEGGITGLATGYPELDAITRGLQPSDLIIIAARPAMGKTALALNLAMRAAISEGAPVGIFSLEMSAEQLVNRMISSEALVDSYSLRKGSLSEEDWDSLAIAASRLSSCNILIDDTSGITVTGTRYTAAADDLNRQMPKFNFVTYKTSDNGLHLISGTQANDAWTLTHEDAALTYTVSPFFADAFALSSNNAPGTAAKPYQVRSIEQLQYINWSYINGQGSTTRDVTGSNSDYKYYPYLQYTNRRGNALQTKAMALAGDSTGGPRPILTWQQTHDLNGAGHGTAADGSSDLWHTDFTGPMALVIGSEGEGLGRLVRERCDFLVSIPLRGKVGSLNASTAAAVLMYEVLRQKLAK